MISVKHHGYFILQLDLEHCPILNILLREKAPIAIMGSREYPPAVITTEQSPEEEVRGPGTSPDTSARVIDG